MMVDDALAEQCAFTLLPCEGEVICLSDGRGLNIAAFDQKCGIWNQKCEANPSVLASQDTFPWQGRSVVSIFAERGAFTLLPCQGEVICLSDGRGLNIAAWIQECGADIPVCSLGLTQRRKGANLERRASAAVFRAIAEHNRSGVLQPPFSEPSPSTTGAACFSRRLKLTTKRTKDTKLL